jgi:hypothetical protein
MTEPMPGTPPYRPGAGTRISGRAEIATIEEVRLRQDAEQEETDLSYLRRMLQGRIDLVRAELSNREAGGSGTSVLEQLPDILRDEASARSALGRHLTLSRAGPASTGGVERVVADIDISDVTARTETELENALAELVDYETAVSRSRKAVQQVADECRRRSPGYRTGEAHVGTTRRGPAGLSRNPVLAEVVRSGFVEGLHRGALVALNPTVRLRLPPATFVADHRPPTSRCRQPAWFAPAYR